MSFLRPKSPSNAPAGEPLVWFTGLGLALALLMVAGLLGVILVNGFTVFTPKRVALITLRDDAPASPAGKTFAAETVGERRRHDEAGATERLAHLGNKDLYGQGFAYVAEKDIASETFPPELRAAERVENGDAFFFPVSLKLADGTVVAATDPTFDTRLDGLIRAGNDSRGRLLTIERDRIGRINRDIGRWDKDIARLEKIGTPEARAEAAELRKAVAASRAEYEALAKEAAAMRAARTADTLAAKTADGRDFTLHPAALVEIHRPNVMGFAERAGLFFKRIARFVADDPREANTEGGVFPAIFGTLVMTVCMSAMVTPFGVLAAIYLREYAKQGFFVRWVRISVNNLAGVPSIVFGIFGLGFFVYFLGGAMDRMFFAEDLPTPTFGTGGLLWAALTLALMTLPVVIVATEEALAAVPRGIREASLALGASKWQTIRNVVLPAAAPGVLTGVILAMARGAGEVAPLMMVGVVKLAPSLPLDGEFPYVHFDRKFMHLGFHIFDIGFQSPDSDAARPMVFATTLLLILIVIVLNLGAVTLRNRLRNKYKSGAF